MTRCLMLAGSVLVAGSVVWAGPLRPAEVAQDAKWVAHVDVDQLKAGEVGRHLVQQLATDEMNTKIAAFTVIFGFDPRRDVASVTAYGRSNLPDQSVALFRGAFDTTRLVTLVQANDTYEGVSYGVHTIHSWVDQNKPRQGRQYGAVHGSGVVILSQGQEMVQVALDVLDGRLPGLDAATAQALQTSDFAPFFVAMAEVGQMTPRRGDSAMMKHVARGEVLMGEKAGVVVGRMMAKAKDGTAASNLFDMANGTLAFAKMGSEENPDLAELARTAQLAKAGETIRLDAQTPAAMIIKFMDQQIAKKQAIREARRKAAAEKAAEVKKE